MNEPPDPGLPEDALYRAAEIVRRARRVAVLSGAGVSAESGVSMSASCKVSGEPNRSWTIAFIEPPRTSRVLFTTNWPSEGTSDLQ